jgi:Divergent InlB B-repeat domain
VNGNYEITASFELEPDWYSLTILSTEGGSVITPGEGQFIYYTGEVVSLVAVPDEHYHFAEWTGDVSTVGNVTAAETTLIMYASYSITASLELDEGWYSLTTSSTDGGSVTTPGEGTYVYSANTSVSLVAVPDGSYQFLRWTGDASTVADVYAATTTIAMNSSYSITANFESPHPEPVAQLTVSSTEGGSVATPGEGVFPYPLGTDVVLVAEAVSGYRFVNWSGDVGTMADVTAISTTITMDNSYDIRANFSGGGGCFIATAAYGAPMAEEIGILREFRDEYLLTGTLGRALVGIYYRVSPPIAEFIDEHPSLKPVVRAGLLPAVAMSALVVNTTAVEKIAMVVLLAMTSVAVAIWLMRRRGKDPQYA